jgi:hypothetical protein
VSFSISSPELVYLSNCLSFALLASDELVESSTDDCGSEEVDFVFFDPDYYESSCDYYSSPSPFASIIAFICFSLSAFLATFYAYFYKASSSSLLFFISLSLSSFSKSAASSITVLGSGINSAANEKHFSSCVTLIRSPVSTPY